jgi:hypothetical protein
MYHTKVAKVKDSLPWINTETNSLSIILSIFENTDLNWSFITFALIRFLEDQFFYV